MSNQIKYLESQIAHWKSNHDNVVNKLRLFTQREDLPVDRIPAYRYVIRLEHENEALRAKLSLVTSRLTIACCVCVGVVLTWVLKNV